MNVFPIKTGPVTEASFAQAWNPGHEGTDIFAPLGAEVLAVADGRVRHAVEEKGGKAVYLVTPDGTQYYYAHLDQFAQPRLGPGETRKVKTGDVIGFVGTTGNAKGKAPHVHFEVRPRGGAKVDPYPLLVAAAGRVTEAPPVVREGWPSAPKNRRPANNGGGLALLVAAFLLMRR